MLKHYKPNNRNPFLIYPYYTGDAQVFIDWFNSRCANSMMVGVRAELSDFESFTVAPVGGCFVLTPKQSASFENITVISVNPSTNACNTPLQETDQPFDAVGARYKLVITANANPTLIISTDNETAYIPWSSIYRISQRQPFNVDNIDSPRLVFYVTGVVGMDTVSIKCKTREEASDLEELIRCHVIGRLY